MSVPSTDCPGRELTLVIADEEDPSNQQQGPGNDADQPGGPGGVLAEVERHDR